MASPNLIGDTTPQLGGNLDTNGNDLNFVDNDKAIFGNSADLEIYHNATNSIIENKTGYLALRSQDGGQIRIEDASGNANALFNDNSDVKLRFNASDRLVTTSAGVEITGTSKSDLVVVDSTGGATPTYSHTNNGEGITLRYNDDSGARAADIVMVAQQPCRCDDAVFCNYRIQLMRRQR